jgi:hypothetical protein
MQDMDEYSEALRDLTCPLSLELFRDPVMLAQSGMTYERENLTAALAARPGIDPQTNHPFTGEPVLKENIVMLRLITWHEASHVADTLSSTDHEA